jgi:hypothetical protein
MNNQLEFISDKTGNNLQVMENGIQVAILYRASDYRWEARRLTGEPIHAWIGVPLEIIKKVFDAYL